MQGEGWDPGRLPSIPRDVHLTARCHRKCFPILQSNVGHTALSRPDAPSQDFCPTPQFLLHLPKASVPSPQFMLPAQLTLSPRILSPSSFPEFL